MQEFRVPGYYFLMFVIAHKGRHYYLHVRDEDSGAQGGKEVCLRTQPLNQASDKNDLSDITILCYSQCPEIIFLILQIPKYS